MSKYSQNLGDVFVFVFKKYMFICNKVKPSEEKEMQQVKGLSSWKKRPRLTVQTLFKWLFQNVILAFEHQFSRHSGPSGVVKFLPCPVLITFPLPSLWKSCMHIHMVEFFMSFEWKMRKVCLPRIFIFLVSYRSL